MEEQWDKEAGQGEKRTGSQVLGWTKVWAGYGRDTRLLSWLLEGQRGPSQRDHKVWGSAERSLSFLTCLCTRQLERRGSKLSFWVGRIQGQFLEGSIFYLLL